MGQPWGMRVEEVTPVERLRRTITIEDSFGRIVCVMCEKDWTMRDFLNNCGVIFASKDLLAACESALLDIQEIVLSMGEICDFEDREAVQLLRSAIAKAIPSPPSPAQKGSENSGPICN